MATHQTSIDVDRPVRTVYNQWTQFESSRRFMDGAGQGGPRPVKSFIESQPGETGAWRGEVGQDPTS